MPRDTLTADRIVHAAIELLDEEGLDGLNMRSLAKRLGSAATAVYWHIKTKDDLVRLASDTVWHEVELPDLDATDWRTAATAQADGMHAMLTRHPWLVQAFGSHLLYGPGQARYNDFSLAVYEKAGFAADDADRAAGTVFTFVLGSTLGPAAQVSLNRRLGRNGADAEQLLADAVARAAETAMEFPRLRERLGTKAAREYAAAPDSTFEFGLRSLLDGFEARLAADRAGRRE
ncbi:TetR family transcriptional regulator [Streptomyces violarus]|uniref:AcrR family transcriptional regulator n=1 Tax=Streptomyces violarus TaxID=67380 RepID=A0A7W4ZQS7_9ACTN|nr:MULTISPECIES: TetR/AcrR family transcriptional regulator C-terminal domain-containing protein [Streptomyces]MBB3076934.1 AcrR family transcriptional regulator [Streptomyces violarus]WRU01407.1 TetR/AcrR family transcriptional regulator C-terminal domain-containing protein [Streptomyces sp. CGMCC 4.1772]GHD22748.1 TetR family transcriptional regulator [Streptomyces violarus]